MSTKFFNNIETRLMDKFHGIASAMANFDIFHAVVGYFRSSGYFKLRKELENVSEIRILVGINIEGRRVSNNIARISSAMSISRNTLPMWMTASANFALTSPTVVCNCAFIPPKTSTRSSISVCRRATASIVTAGSFDVHYCEEEFQHLWNDAIPVTMDDVNRIVDGTHLAAPEHQPTPYELYMRMLIDHFGNQVEDYFVPHLPDNYDDLTYQRDAVVQGYDIMMRHGGCFIADVVGLGKTVVAAMIAQRFIAANGDNTRILVIFPPSVKTNWEDTFRDFRIKNKYSRFVSNGSLDKVVDGDGYDEKEYYDLIIVDEAHNFRHDSTGNYDLLQRICKSARLNKGNVEGNKEPVAAVSGCRALHD